MNKENQEPQPVPKKDVEVMIDVSSNELEAYITLLSQKENPLFSTQEIEKALVQKGIIFGINKEALSLLEKEVKYKEKILIASGTKPTEPTDGKINYYLNADEKVSKGQKIGEIITPIAGSEGINVFSKKIPPKEPKKAIMPEFINIEPSVENKNILVAKIDGYFGFDQLSCMVTPFFTLEKSEDEYEAYLKVLPPLHDADFDQKDLRKFLTESGIIFGIIEEETEKIFQVKKFAQKILIAQGKRVLHGKDGILRYYFDTVIQARMDKKGRVNYKELNLIQSVKKGDKLAEVIPPEKGIEGCTVSGKKIEPKEGILPVLPTGRNAQPDPENPKIIIAGADGHVRLHGKSVEVDPVFMVKGDIDFSTGNVDFDGPVVVNGDVRSGFRIKTKNDVQINGVVEDAVIEASGNVMLKTGFIGHGHGKIIAQGEVTVKFCENENISAEGDVYIGEYAMHSRIQTKGIFYATNQKGLVIGGEICAVKGIEANVVGNENYTPTNLIAGWDKEIVEKTRGNRVALLKNSKHIKIINDALYKFMRRKLVKKPLPGEMDGMAEQLSRLKEQKEAEIKKISAEISDLERVVSDFKNAVIKITECVYPGTMIRIYNRHIMVNEPVKYVYYKYSEHEIASGDLEKLS